MANSTIIELGELDELDKLDELDELDELGVDESWLTNNLEG
jgi:hypothetical protein